MNLNDYGFQSHNFPEHNCGIPARVTSVHKERYAIICEYGQTYARLKTKAYFADKYRDFPTTGDFILIQYVPNGDSLILDTLPRRTFFSRRDPTPGRGEQAVASNFDYVFIMQSLNQDFNPRRLERYLTLAWQSGAAPVVILTKADLVQDHSHALHLAGQIAAGAPVHAVSAKTGYGLETLSGYFAPGKTVVFLGSSGIGKSSLVNALAGEEIMTVNGIRENDGKGRHTTTHRQLIRLQNGAMIIDTPGMRELGMWDVSEGLGEAFSDVTQFLGRCKFSDCRHQTEPGCAIRQAIETGALSQQRWDSYISLHQEAKYTDKSAFLRQKQQRNKAIAKQTRQRKKDSRFNDGF